MAELNGAYGYGNLTPHTARKPRFQTAQKTSDTDGGKTDATAAPMLSAVKLNAQAKASHANAQQHHSTRRSGSTAVRTHTIIWLGHMAWTCGRCSLYFLFICCSFLVLLVVCFLSASVHHLIMNLYHWFVMLCLCVCVV
eukprot:m.105751 g.105751  ORF g.105751 m.105751 type:complete len:139 (-) comp13285_c0_seq4:2066-2482(-)